MTMGQLRLSAEELRTVWQGKKSSRRAHPRDMEHRLQVECVRWFRYAFPHFARLLFAVPNGGDRDIRVAQRLKAEGVVPGVADLLLLVPCGGYHGLCVEMKTQKGRQSDNQRLFQCSVEAQGYRYALCRDMRGFISTIEQYLKNETNDTSKEE